MKEDYCNFEIAKLLKEKGFNEYVEWAYRYFAENNICVIHINEKPASTLIENCYPYVTLQMAMKWLREVHNIFIQIELYSKHNDYCFELFQNTHRLMVEKREVYNSFEETCETAIKYCLTNLI